MFYLSSSINNISKDIQYIYISKSKVKKDIKHDHKLLWTLILQTFIQIS